MLISCSARGPYLRDHLVSASINGATRPYRLGVNGFQVLIAHVTNQPRDDLTRMSWLVGSVSVMEVLRETEERLEQGNGRSIAIAVDKSSASVASLQWVIDYFLR